MPLVTLKTEAPTEVTEPKEDIVDKTEDEPCYENASFFGELIGELVEVFYFLVSVQDHTKAVPVDKFGEHVQRMHADRDKWFEQEYNVRKHTVIFGVGNLLMREVKNMHVYVCSKS